MTAIDAAAAMPERVGRYELLFPIGTGGMGTVYLGQSEVLPGVKREVAVKLMHAELRANPEIGPQLMQEAVLAASIDHPNVVSVREAGESPHGVFLVMDYVEGETLAWLIRKARARDELIPLRIAGKILRDALTGLHAAHELKSEGRPLELVHRDFSPQNILVGLDGISRLTDFGIAKALSDVGTTTTGVVKGKVAYMSPEQARGERIDRRSDVWAAGVVTWEVLTARRLFRASNETATLLQIVSGKRPPRVRSVRPDVPALLDEAVAAALEPKARARLASAQAFRRGLDEALADLGVAEEDEVASYLRDLIGPAMAERRERAREVVALRARIADIASVAAEKSATTLGSAPGTDAFSEPTTGKRLSYLWAIGALAVGAAAAGVVHTIRPREEVKETIATPAVPESAVESPLATAVPPVAILTVDANEPIAQLALDERSIVMPAPERRVEIPVPDTGASRIAAMTPDGRRAEAALEPGQRAVVLTFAGKPPPSPGPASPRVKTPPPPSDGLAASPYGAE